ncbi:MAG: hydrogenase, partial [Desulfobacterales bacterium]
MNHFFVALALILYGGLVPLFFRRQFAFMKAAGTLSIAFGCLLGLVDAIVKLFHPRIYSASFSYLNAFSLTFQIDALSSFFLITIFAVSLLAALYSFHYMDNPAKALRTAIHYFFFSLLVTAMALVVTANNLISFILSWEIMSLSSFFLVVYNYE